VRGTLYQRVLYNEASLDWRGTIPGVFILYPVLEMHIFLLALAAATAED
jgi:hypothetical protein